MKYLGMTVVVLIGLVMATTFAVAQSGDFNLDWWTVDGGGGESSGGDYTLQGTIGQPDAGKMSGGDYELSGGFWLPAGSSSGGPGASGPPEIHLPFINRH